MKIRLETISKDGLVIKDQLEARILPIKENDIKFDAPIDVIIKAILASGTLMINGSVKTFVSLSCSRCLKPITKELANENFDLVLDVTGLTEVDITDNIREAVLILLPIKPLCKFACKGLCPQCGQNLNEKKCQCRISQGDAPGDGINKLRLTD